jgi:hypothetical protein
MRTTRPPGAKHEQAKALVEDLSDGQSYGGVRVVNPLNAAK